MTVVSLRPKRPDDIDAIVNIIHHARHHNYPAFLDPDIITMMTPDFLKRKYLTQHNEPNIISIVATDTQDHVLWALSYRTNSKISHLCDYRTILNLYVDPETQWQGIGTQLIEYIKQHQHPFLLWTLRDNLPTRTFYTKNGGQEFACRIHDRDGHPERQICYIRDT